MSKPSQSNYSKLVIAACALALATSQLLPAFALGNDVSGQSTNPQTKDSAGAAPPKLDVNSSLEINSIMNEILKAYGGKEALARLLQSSILFGREKALGGAAGSYVFRQIRKGSKLRLDLGNAQDANRRFPDPQSTAQSPNESGYLPLHFSCVTAFDGASGWRAFGRRVTKLSDDALKLLEQEADHDPASLSHWQEPGYTFRLLGRTQYKMMPAIAIEMQRNDDSPVTFFINPETHLVTALSYKAKAVSKDPKQTGVETEVMLEFSDWHAVAGTMVAFNQKEYANKNYVRELVLEKINLADPVDDALFERPKEITSIQLTQPIILPFVYLDHEILIKVRVNDRQPVDFLLDTGASQTVIDRRVAASMLLEKQGALNIASASGSLSAQTTNLAKLEVGNLAVQDAPAIICDLTAESRQLGRLIAGIIGNDFLSQFALTIDYAKQTATLSDPGKLAINPQATIVPVTHVDIAPTIKGMINGKEEVDFLIDTGAAINSLPRTIAEKYLQGKSAQRQDGFGLDGNPLVLMTVPVDSVSFGTQSVNNVNFAFKGANAKEPARITFADKSTIGILGNPFWQNFIVSLNYKTGHLSLYMNPLFKAKQEISKLTAQGDTSLVVQRDYRLAAQTYRRALNVAVAQKDQKAQAILLGRLGNTHRVMAKDLSRPDQAPVAYDHFARALKLSEQLNDKPIKGHILADFSLLYSDKGQFAEADRTISDALRFAPDDPQVNVDAAVHLYRKRQFAEMQQYVNKALNLDPTNWQALWYRVKLRELYGDAQSLQAALKEILHFYPSSQLARQKMDQLTK